MQGRARHCTLIRNRHWYLMTISESLSVHFLHIDLLFIVSYYCKPYYMFFFTKHKNLFRKHNIRTTIDTDTYKKHFYANTNNDKTNFLRSILFLLTAAITWKRTVEKIASKNASLLAVGVTAANTIAVTNLRNKQRVHTYSLQRRKIKKEENERRPECVTDIPWEPNQRRRRAFYPSSL